MLKTSIFFTLLFYGICYSQTGGEQTFLILNTNSSAKQTALGGKTLTSLNDVNQPLYNPAALNADLDRKVSINYNSHISDIAIGSASYAHKFDRSNKTFYGNISYINYGSFIEADTNGNEIGTFNASDIFIALGYADNIPNTNLHWGTNIKFIHSSIAAYTASGIAMDLGLIYYKHDKPYVATLVIRNFGTQLSTFTDTKEPLPFEIAIGASYLLENVPLKWYITMDNLQKWNIAVANPSNAITDLEGNRTEEKINFFDNLTKHFSLGAELFPKGGFNLRLGYNFRRASELKLQNVRSFSGLSFGFGLKIKKIKLNYAFSKYHLATSTSTFNLEIDLTKKAVYKKPKKF